MRVLGSCWVPTSDELDDCAGEVSRWIILIGGNPRMPVEIWTCEEHERIPFSELVDLAVPINELRASQPLEITPLRKREADTKHSIHESRDSPLRLVEIPRNEHLPNLQGTDHAQT